MGNCRSDTKVEELASAVIEEEEENESLVFYDREFPADFTSLVNKGTTSEVKDKWAKLVWKRPCELGQN